jgi:hypothetical protein
MALSLIVDPLPSPAAWPEDDALTVIPGRPMAEPGIHSHYGSGRGVKLIASALGVVVMDSGLRYAAPE